MLSFTVQKRYYIFTFCYFLKHGKSLTLFYVKLGLIHFTVYKNLVVHILVSGIGGNKLGKTELSSMRNFPLSRTGLTPLRGANP